MEKEGGSSNCFGHKRKCLCYLKFAVCISSPLGCIIPVIGCSLELLLPFAWQLAVLAAIGWWSFYASGSSVCSFVDDLWLVDTTANILGRCGPVACSCQCCWKSGFWRVSIYRKWMLYAPLLFMFCFDAHTLLVLPKRSLSFLSFPLFIKLLF